MPQNSARSWAAAFMMIVAILAVCVLVPSGFMSAGPFARWLRSVGIHMSPNMADGYPIAEFTSFDRVFQDPLPGVDSSEVQRALAVRRFSVKKVAFRRWSGLGIAPRVNLSFDFDGQLPDPQNSPRGFSMTTIHVYIKVPGKQTEPVLSNKVAKVDFGSPGWNYQVIIDGFHDHAQVFDSRGNLVARGLGLYVDKEKIPVKGSGNGTGASAGRTRLTAALPLEYLGDPARGDWEFYVLVGLSDSRNPSMMLHSAADTRPSVFCAALTTNQQATAGERPCLRPLAVRNPV
jgi:hypothetical protein